MNLIPYGKHTISEKDKKFVLKSLGDDLITSGNYVKSFEADLSKFLKVNHALSCSSGTSAIHLALLSLNIKKGDSIIIPSINFIAAYNMSRLLGAKVYLADVDPILGQMSPKNLLNCIKVNKIKNLKVVFTMYLGGYPKNIIEFYNIKKKYKFYIIEDACHALGAKYLDSQKNWTHIGSCRHSDICVFSLHPLKTITSGEGGILTTNNKNIYNKIKIFRSHGIQRTKFHWIYNAKYNGFNYRLSDINCALGLSQLKRIKNFILKRKQIYNLYNKLFFSLKNVINIDFFLENVEPAYHLYLLNINFKKLNISKNNFIKLLLKKKIYVQQHYIPIYKFKNIYKKKFLEKNFLGATNYFNSTISLPIFVDLSKRQQIYVAQTIKSLILQKSK
jgi:dTDP-4-amino-4,6-dideoxygalactose transaminase